MANTRNYPTPNQDLPGFGSPYQGSGFNNLDNFLNAGNIDWGNQQLKSPSPMDTAKNRTSSQAGFENWMYGASEAPQRNALKEAELPTGPKASQPDTGKKPEANMWTRDNSGWEFDRQKYEREFMHQDDQSPEALQRWIEQKKDDYWREFQQGEEYKKTGGAISIPGTQPLKSAFPQFDGYLGW